MAVNVILKDSSQIKHTREGQRYTAYMSLITLFKFPR